MEYKQTRPKGSQLKNHEEFTNNISRQNNVVCSKLHTFETGEIARLSFVNVINMRELLVRAAQSETLAKTRMAQRRSGQKIEQFRYS